MLGRKPCSTPVAPGSKTAPRDDTPLSNPIDYQRTLATLQHPTLTRLDISYAVNQVFQFLHAPANIHDVAVKSVLRYFKGSLDHGVSLKPGCFDSFVGYCYADWAGSPSTR